MEKSELPDKGQKKTKPERKNEKKKTFAKKVFKKKRTIRLSRKKYQEKVVQVTRVTKVVKGGKKMTFRAIVIIGDRKRKVGVGIGRGEDVVVAIDKAILHGKKHLITVPLTHLDSIPHIVHSSYGACKILLRPAAQGTGVIAGGSVRAVLELAGMKNILAKQFGSSNILNNAKATIQALTLVKEKIALGTIQSKKKKLFYKKIMKNYKDGLIL